MLITRKRTTKPITQVLRELKQRIEAHGFSIHQVIEMHRKIAKDGVRPAYRRYYIVQFCHPGKANKALKLTPDVGVMMPKSFTLYETRSGEVVVAFMTMPSLVVRVLFGKQLQALSKRVLATMDAIADEVSEG